AEANLVTLRKEQAARLVVKGDNLFSYGEKDYALYEYKEAEKLDSTISGLSEKMAQCMGPGKLNR
ncbi:MAG: hypothetical protein ABIQ93_03855, partial [Saprospiraceae bacterium]